MRPSEANARLDLLSEERDGKEHLYYELSFEGMNIATRANFAEMTDTLGCNHEALLKVDDLSEMEDIVDRALSLAPRARGR